MEAYLQQLRQIREQGNLKQQRAVLQSGVRPRVRSLFGMQARYDLRLGFPIVTTKRVPFKMVAEELAWFLSGSTNNHDLRQRGCTIWDEWADPVTGELGPIYGQQWRRWKCEGGKTWDQVRGLVDGIKERVRDPEASIARRLLLTAWNPPEMPLTRGPSACHTLAQFDVTEDRLSCQLYQRSADMFLGVPFNIACYALLTHLLAQTTNLKVGEFIHTMGDAHIYENHFPQVDEQLQRQPRPLPTLWIDPEIRDIDDFTSSQQVKLIGYDPHPRLATAEVAV
ncbi:MAG: thymidylate synthase [Planctomycetia bacterium]|nr:thymidylate synthase [Planctomycetia bacterium]